MFKKLTISIAYCLVIMLFSSCSFPSLSSAKLFSDNVLKELSCNNWDFFWNNASETYKKKVDRVRLNKLRKWIDAELGLIKEYENTYFYSGSSFGITGGFFVKARYQVKFDKGPGEIELTFVKENNRFKILNFDIYKKPIY
ncbi:MAG TPA: hypothetical protein PK385_05855 [Spirochaetota bacterium]|jgi:hypothetical protein|nr:MAG: hypothetical protein BWX91_00363 [Spirochaetes bacterium ADurb.Bin133]HOF01567.1 hypothetical protein [Spirochaetota bacterium]HOS55563.1 hypothetical protein [Spirochaetota bacterium]HPK61745.1 hypothetical protein [Spirochaetota bacterium]HPY86400.1 hypothetical protein [Spirochaetota bacterium]